MKAKEIRDLIDFISNSGLDEVNIETQEFKIAVKKNSPIINTITETPVTVTAPQQNTEVPQVQQSGASTSDAPESDETSDYIEIKSPMIGTFYLTPSPDSEAFVKLGDSVKVGQTVCIVEAMKLFNEIESEYSGKIVKLLVENASPVEFDQPLFLLDPA
jgi:acetyl-CoA carboxylase biotin carboxyl carrier protein